MNNLSIILVRHWISAYSFYRWENAAFANAFITIKLKSLYRDFNVNVLLVV